MCEDQLTTGPHHPTTPKESNIGAMPKSKGKGVDWNYFSLRRTCFRGMSAYYKDKFDPIYKTWMKYKQAYNRATMDELVEGFIKDEFLGSSRFSTLVSTPEFLDSMVTVLHSHRHKKSEAYIKSRDFTKIRQVLYSFSTSAKKAFLTNKAYALIFVHFYETQGEKFVKEKAQTKPKQFETELRVEFEAMYKLAVQSMENA